jgi:hypothetical protein
VDIAVSIASAAIHRIDCIIRPGTPERDLGVAT